jgi:hypothetical protein
MLSIYILCIVGLLCGLGCAGCIIALFVYDNADNLSCVWGFYGSLFLGIMAAMCITEAVKRADIVGNINMPKVEKAHE